MSKKVKITQDSNVKPEWKDKNGKSIAMSEMTPEQLRRAKHKCQAKILTYENKQLTFYELVALLDEEAERRNIELGDYDREFFRNEKILKKKLQKS